MIFKRDSLALGLILGLVGPVLGLIVIYFVQFSTFSFGEFMNEFSTNNRLMTSTSTLSLLANALMFALYVHFNKYNTFKGIFLVTLVYGIIILVLKVFN